MSNDLSRKIFNPLDDYFGVVMQQGRVQMDADWNTLVDQFKRRIQAESLDTFGPDVVPRETPDGFLISGPVAAIEIGPGRIYVDGLLAENHTDVLKWDARLAEISGTARLSGADVDAPPTGLVGTTAYDNQPYYPDPPALPDGETYLVYLDVWQRDITYLQDAGLVDSAVGVDTTARQQTVWQVKFLDNVGALDPTVEDVDIPGWLKTIHPSSARLSTATGDLTDDDNPCLLPPQAGYKGLENQLYRVQVHDGGPVGSATFKWSRDNAVVSTRVSAIPGGNEIVVDSLGRDAVLGFNEGDWLEITDDHRDLMGMPGELRRIQLGDGIDTSTRTITLEGNALPIGSGVGEFPVDGNDQTEPTRNTRIIRWDQAGIVFREDESEYTDLDAPASTGAIEIPAAGTRLFLEKGILVDFDLESVVDEASFDPVFKTGDYWLFSARVNDASIELLDRVPPEGIHHHYAKLAIVSASGISDCRTLWPPQSGAESCACTVCVHPDGHNNGSATIQQAIDQVNALGGGTVCLSTGEFQISQPVRITGNSVTLRGQGWQTMLISRNSASLIEIGGESVTTDTSVENILCLTSVVQGVSSAITVNNVMGLCLNDCFIANLAAGGGTSQGIRFTGLAVMVAVSQCNLLAEQGITGPRLQDEMLGTMDFSVRDCILSCSLQGVSFNGFSFHLNKLDLTDNHIGNSRDAGIELGGVVFENTVANIKNNLLVNCQNAIRSGVGNLRIHNNDMIAESDGQNAGNGITFIDGLDPADTDNQQVIGNRIRNYQGHAIAVQARHPPVTEFSDVGGVISANENHFAAVFLEASIRADISNNLFDGIVQTSNPATSRSAIEVASSNDVKISGNRIIAVTPPSYTGLGAGIIISSSVGSFEVSNNEVSRAASYDDGSGENLSAAIWLPLFVNGERRSAIDDAAGVGRFGNTRFLAGLSETSVTLRDNAAPVVNVNNRAYALRATRLVNLGASTPGRQAVNITRNRLDGSSGSSIAVYILAPAYCGFIDNEVISDNPGALVVLSADQVGANNNRLMTSDDLDILIIQSRRYVIMGNMSTGNIGIAEDGEIKRPPEPWKSLNIII